MLSNYTVIIVNAVSVIDLYHLLAKNHASFQLISDKIQIILFYLSLVRSVACEESEVKLFACKEIINRW
jgi:hypothetical protein